MRLLAGLRAQVGEQARADVLGLADVQDLPVLGQHPVGAGTILRIPQLRVEGMVDGADQSGCFR